MQGAVLIGIASGLYIFVPTFEEMKRQRLNGTLNNGQSPDQPQNNVNNNNGSSNN